MPTDVNEGGLLSVLERASFGVSVQSDFAREMAGAVAEAASRGLLTTETPQRSHGRLWTLTARGRESLDYLRSIA